MMEDVSFVANCQRTPSLKVGDANAMRLRSALPCLIFVLFLKNNDLRARVLLQLVTLSVVVFSFGLFHFDYVTSVLKVTLIVSTGGSVNHACK